MDHISAEVEMLGVKLTKNNLIVEVKMWQSRPRAGNRLYNKGGGSVYASQQGVCQSSWSCKKFGQEGEQNATSKADYVVFGISQRARRISQQRTRRRYRRDYFQCTDHH